MIHFLTRESLPLMIDIKLTFDFEYEARNVLPNKCFSHKNH